MPLMQFVGNLGYVAVTILGGYLAIKKTIEVGQIQSFLQYVRNFSQPITQLAQVGNMMQTTAASAERVFEFLEEEEEIEVFILNLFIRLFWNQNKHFVYYLSDCILKHCIPICDNWNIHNLLSCQIFVCNDNSCHP